MRARGGGRLKSVAAFMRTIRVSVNWAVSYIFWTAFSSLYVSLYDLGEQIIVGVYARRRLHLVPCREKLGESLNLTPL